jgi:hypothetical protein
MNGRRTQEYRPFCLAMTRRGSQCSNYGLPDAGGLCDVHRSRPSAKLFVPPSLNRRCPIPECHLIGELVARTLSPVTMQWLCPRGHIWIEAVLVVTGEGTAGING